MEVLRSVLEETARDPDREAVFRVQEFSERNSKLINIGRRVKSKELIKG